MYAVVAMTSPEKGNNEERLVPTATLIAFEDLPPQVMETFAQISQAAEDSEGYEAPLKVSEPFVARDVSARTFGFRVDIPAPKGIPLEESLVVMVDLDHEGKQIGYGVIAKHQATEDGLEVDSHPFVAYTETTGETRKGLGTRRLRLMNQLASKNFGEPVYSSLNNDFMSETPIRMWLRLVEAGEAEQVVLDGVPRFRFKDPNASHR